MINPDTLVATLVTRLKAIPGVVLAVAAAANISGHVDGSTELSLVEQAAQMPVPSILVGYEGTETPEDGPDNREHKFVLYLRPAEGYGFGATFAAIVNGKPDPVNTFEYCDLGAGYLSMRALTSERFVDDDNKELLAVSVQIVEQGIGGEE